MDSPQPDFQREMTSFIEKVGFEVFVFVFHITQARWWE
jgi:hypothetical protein